jgi:hypothetical protein
VTLNPQPFAAQLCIADQPNSIGIAIYYITFVLSEYKSITAAAVAPVFRCRTTCPNCLALPAISLLQKISNHLDLVRPDARLQELNERQVS